MPSPKWLDDNASLATALGANNKLVGKAANLKVGDLWRMAGWVKQGDPPKADQPRLQLNMEELQSIADSFTGHLVNPGGQARGEWTYTKDYLFSCCCCTACCAVMTMPSAPTGS
jgi:hypothetical protein